MEQDTLVHQGDCSIVSFAGRWVGEESGTWVAVRSSERDLRSCLQTTNILFDLEHCDFQFAVIYISTSVEMYNISDIFIRDIRCCVIRNFSVT